MKQTLWDWTTFDLDAHAGRVWPSQSIGLGFCLSDLDAALVWPGHRSQLAWDLARRPWEVAGLNMGWSVSALTHRNLWRPIGGFQLA